jgi:hypothetical protein
MVPCSMCIAAALLASRALIFEREPHFHAARVEAQLCDTSRPQGTECPDTKPLVFPFLSPSIPQPAVTFNSSTFIVMMERAILPTARWPSEDARAGEPDCADDESTNRRRGTPRLTTLSGFLSARRISTAAENRQASGRKTRAGKTTDLVFLSF